jgi:hypothetical protein
MESDSDFGGRAEDEARYRGGEARPSSFSSVGEKRTIKNLKPYIGRNA